VIGIDAYDGRSWPQLSNGVRDAEEVAKGLAAQGFEVALKKNLKSGELEDALKYFFHHEGNDPDTRLLLWFAGHGHTLDGEGYIIPADAPSPKDVGDFRDKAISLRRFGEYMREANAKHVLAIFDSCFSGTVFNVARSLPPPAITLATTQPVREFISSGEAEQTVSDDGTFRKLFLDVLAGNEPDADANHDGYVTGTELGLFLHQKMTNFTNNRQTPRYGKLNAYGYDRGDFVFQVGKPDAPPITSETQSTNEAAHAWATIKDTKSSAEVEIFLRRYPEGFYSDLARKRLPELKALEAIAREEARLKIAEMAQELEKRRVAEVSPAVTPANPCSSQITNVSLSSRSAQPLSAAQECALKPKGVFKECDKCPEMIVVPSGSFTMGSPNNEAGHSEDEGPLHTVTIAHAFAVGKFTVTVDQFTDFVNETGYDAGSECLIIEEGKLEERPGHSFRDPGFPQTGSHPAVCLSWNDANAYVAWLSKKTGKPYRLLTEAEWEYAARARTEPGSYPRYFFGDRDDDMCRYGNVADQTTKSKIGGRSPFVVPTSFHCNDGNVYTARVGSFLPNAFGVYDMLGNASQRLEDCWHANYQGAPTDGSAWNSGDCGWRVVRGGSWEDGPEELRAGRRGYNATEDRISDGGFRVARTLSP
jgi:formylglycine-generating enzyme required for sulfatase activity